MTDEQKINIKETKEEVGKEKSVVETSEKKVKEVVSKKENAHESKIPGATESKAVPLKTQSVLETSTPSRLKSSHDVSKQDSVGEKENIEKKKEPEKPKKPIVKNPVVKKNYAITNPRNLHISTKISRDICKFIKGKKIDDAIANLEEVEKLKKAVPTKGEYAHRKGKMMSGKFPQKAAGEFIKVLKGLQGNININGLEEPIIVEAKANIGERPFGRFGSIRRKRTHLTIKVMEKK